jgi:hypothetical protein
MKKQFLFSFFLLFFFIVYAQEKIVWDYPIKPRMKEWATFETGEQMVKACQIPLDVLNTISTKDLVTVCLNYPLFNNYMAFNDEREGVNITIRQFNGLQELGQRKDGTQELIKAYANYPILSKVQNDVNSKDYHIPYKLSFLELVLSDNVFLSKMDNDELEELRKIVANKYADKLQNSEVYSLFSIKKTMLLAAVIMNKQRKTEEQDVINTFIQSYNHLESNILTEMSKLITE